MLTGAAFDSLSSGEISDTSGMQETVTRLLRRLRRCKDDFTNQVYLLLLACAGAPVHLVPLVAVVTCQHVGVDDRAEAAWPVVRVDRTLVAGRPKYPTKGEQLIYPSYGRPTSDRNPRGSQRRP